MPKPYYVECESGHIVPVDWETVVRYCGGIETARLLDEMLPPINSKLLSSDRCSECRPGRIGKVVNSIMDFLRAKKTSQWRRTAGTCAVSAVSFIVLAVDAVLLETTHLLGQSTSVYIFAYSTVGFFFCGAIGLLEYSLWRNNRPGSFFDNRRRA
jgi:hypothetical protein